MDTRRCSPTLRLVAALALVVVGLAGCGGTGPVGRGPVATVDGKEISRSDLDALISAQEDLIRTGAEQARQQAESGEAGFTSEDVDRSLDEQLAAIAGSGSSTISTDAASRQLTEMVRLELLAVALDRAGGEVTDEQRAQARNELEAGIRQGGLEPEDVSAVLVDHYVELAALNTALQEVIPDDVTEGLGMSAEDYEALLQQVFEVDGASYRQICFLGPVFDDEASADGAAERIRAGEDLGQVAADLASADPDLAQSLDQCETIPAGSLVELVGDDAFTAEPGHVFDPAELPGVAADGGSVWVLIVVEDVDVPGFEDLRDQLAQDFPDTTQAQIDEARDLYLDDLIGSVFDEAEVTIDPRFGTWDSATGSVVPPVDAGAAPAASWDEIYGSAP